MENPTRQPLGVLLVRHGLIEQAALDECLVEHRATGRRLGRVLVSRGLITPERLTHVLSFQLSLPWVTLVGLDPAADVVALLPRQIAERHRFVPVCMRNQSGKRVLYVATDDPTNADGLSDCSRAIGCAVQAMVAAPDDVSAALQRHYGVTPTFLPPSFDKRKLAAQAADAGRARPPPPPRRAPPAEAPSGALRAHVTIAPSAATAPVAAPAPAVAAAEAPDIDLGRPESLPPEPALPAKIPGIAVIGASPEFIARCRYAVDALDYRVHPVSVADVAVRVQELRPVVIVVMEDVYAFDRVAFTRLGLEVGAALVIWNDELDVDFLEPVLETARRR